MHYLQNNGLWAVLLIAVVMISAALLRSGVLGSEAFSTGWGDTVENEQFLSEMPAGVYTVYGSAEMQYEPGLEGEGIVFENGEDVVVSSGMEIQLFETQTLRGFPWSRIQVFNPNGTPGIEGWVESGALAVEEL